MLRLAAVVGASSLAASLQIAAPPVMMPWKGARSPLPGRPHVAAGFFAVPRLHFVFCFILCYTYAWAPHRARAELGAATEFGAVKFSVAVKETGHAEIVKIARAVSDPRRCPLCRALASHACRSRSAPPRLPSDTRSTRRSAEYGKHLTSVQIQKLTAPAAADAEAVQQWLSAAPDCAVQVRAQTPRLVQLSSARLGS